MTANLPLVLGLVGTAPYSGAGHHFVDCVQKRASARFHHIGGDAARVDSLSGDVDLHRDIADGIGAGSHRSNLEADQVGVDADRFGDGVAGGVDHAVSGGV